MAIVRPRALLGVFALALAVNPPASAQTPLSRPGEPDVPEKVGKEMVAHYVGQTPPRIDGQLDDEIWQLAQAVEDLVQQDPDNMQAPTERTVVRVAYDDRSVYVAVMNYMRDPSRITTALGRRDTFPRSDSIKITFDPRHDHLTAYTFDSNPAGVQGDIMWFDDTRQSTDYDAVWDVRTEITQEGWTAEFRIPFSQLRFTITPGQPVVWGFNIRRDIVYNAETNRWVGTPRGAQGFVSRFGHLTFNTAPAPPRRFELQPFTLARSEHVTEAGADGNFSAGMDMRVGLGTSTTLSAAVNPDFGQVEQDPAVLNLSVFETFFPEKRPFFIEDSRTLVPPYGQTTMFHSRRIGQRPGRLAVPEDETVLSRPDATTILGTVKVTGKSQGWTYGGLTSLTDSEYALVETADGSRTERLIEPMTSYNVGRVSKDMLGGSLGGIVTGVVRDQDFNAYTGAFDYSVRWDENKYNLNGMWGGTHAPIDGAMETGFGGVSNFNYNSKHLGLFGHYDYFNDTYRISDLGFFGNRNNKTQVNGGFNLIQPDPQKHFRSAVLFSNAFYQWNGDWLALDESYFVGGEVQFLNYWSAFMGTGRSRQTYDDLDTRGGPPIVKPASWWFDSFIGTDSRKKYRLSFNFNMSGSEVGSENYRYNVQVNLQPRPAIQATLRAEYTTGYDDAQWIENTDATGDGVDDHIYGSLDRDVVSITARGTYAFTRDMTLEVYVQPFVAVGDYTNIRRLAAPNSYQFEPVTIEDNPDFNNKSLRSNVVFRWEYRRGSTFFVVWNVSNSDTARPGDFSPWRDLGTGFGAAGTQVFMVKLSYWLGL
jgi:hypothetical protein